MSVINEKSSQFWLVLLTTRNIKGMQDDTTVTDAAVVADEVAAEETAAPEVVAEEAAPAEAEAAN